jgi:hypothetical protein
MNLENLNLVVLNAQEAEETTGGKLTWWDAAAALAYDIVSNWESSKAAFNKGNTAF